MSTDDPEISPTPAAGGLPALQSTEGMVQPDRGRWDLLRRNPSVWLLSVQLLSLLIYPLVDDEGSNAERSVVALLGLLALVLATRLVVSTPLTVWVSVLVGLPALALTLAGVLTMLPDPWPFWNDVFHTAFYAYAAMALVTYMVKDVHVSADELFAVGATFTVGVWAFAHAYSALQYLQPGSFIAALNTDEPRTWMELLFLSGTTLTSTGLSDVVPVRPMARAIVMIQQIAGMLYIAMVISHLVALGVGNRRSQRPA